MAYCVKCGTRINSTDKFCRSCGASVSGYAAANDSDNEDVFSAIRSGRNSGQARREEPAVKPQERREPVPQPSDDIPVFTPPGGDASGGDAGADIPVFTPPGGDASGGDAGADIPVFTPPGGDASGGDAGADIPVFTPPGGDASGGDAGADIPVFTPPDNKVISTGQAGDDIPVFTPPDNDIPIFRPPTFTGPSCYHHPDSPAVANCARCGKSICQDCAEAYSVSAGEYAGHYLCFDCCEQLVSDNVNELTKNKRVIMGQFILSLVGIVIGFIMGLSAGISSGETGAGLILGFVYGCVGGVFLTALKAFFSLAWEAIKIAFSGRFGLVTVISLMFQIMVVVVKCIYLTVSNTIFYIRYLKRTSGFIEADRQALAQMKDYMEYTLVRSRNKGISLDNLMGEEGELYNNSYARAVRENGEAQADAALSRATTRIAENGEIIREFNRAA